MPKKKKTAKAKPKATSEPQGFRIARTQNFLTYSQTTKGMTAERLREHLEKIVSKVGLENYLIAQERHKDGGYHLHAYIKTKAKFESENVEIFDWIRYGKTYHPNIQAVKGDKYKLFRYIKKSGEAIQNKGFETRPDWQVILEESTSDLEFLENIMHVVGGRLTSYAGYRTMRDLWEAKKSVLPEEAPKIDTMSINAYMRYKGLTTDEGVNE